MAPFVRIALRVLAGMLAGWGLGISDEEAVDLLVNPEMIAAVVLALNEAWYLAARRFGWSK